MAGLLCGVVRKTTVETRDPVMAACCAILEAAQAAITFNCASFPTCYGPEFAAEALQDWLRCVGIKPIRIFPGSPWENGYNERFNGTLRREVLNAEWFTTTQQAQIVINHWLRQYNHTRPHQALNMRPPVPETLLEKAQISGSEIGG